jgi:Heavy metal binding domain
MKRVHPIAMAAFVAASAILTLSMTGCTGSGQNDKAASSSAQQDSKAVKYTCSMHPEVVQDKPGDCPKCGMKLVEKR